MSWQLLEDEIVALIDAATDPAKLTARPFPQFPSEFETPKTRVFVDVSVHGAEYGDPRSTETMVQFEELVFQISIRARDLRNDYGIYDTINRIRQAILGKQLTGADRIKFMKVQKNEYIDGLHDYSLFINSQRMIVEDEEKDTGPNLDTIILNQNIS